MNLPTIHLRRKKVESEEERQTRGLSSRLLALVAAAFLLLAGCTADGYVVNPAVFSAPQPAMHRGVPVGFTAEGYPYRGDPNAAITIYEYSDYECPFCARHVIQTEPALLAGYAEEGAVKFVFRDMPLSALHANALSAAIAANCMAEQDIVLFWQMHDKIFRTQKEWAPREEALSYFAELAQELGADSSEYGSCMANSDALVGKVNESLDEARALGFTGTPSFRFVYEETGDEFSLTGAQPFETFSDWIETIALGDSPQGSAQAQQQQQQQEQQQGRWTAAVLGDGLGPAPRPRPARLYPRRRHLQGQQRRPNRGGRIQRLSVPLLQPPHADNPADSG